MAQVEFTQQFKVEYASANPYYVQLQTTAGIYVVKGLSCYSDVGVTAVSGPCFQLISASSDSGGGITYLYSTETTVAANTIIKVLSPVQQVILTQGYLGFTAFSSSYPGNMIIQISYSFIPSSNVLAANFANSYSQITAGSTGAAFTGSSATIPTLIKSIMVTNPTNTGTVTVTPLLTTASTTDLAFDSTATVVAGSTYIYTLPLYLTSADTITIQTTGSSQALDVLYSYTQEQI